MVSRGWMNWVWGTVALGLFAGCDAPGAVANGAKSGYGNQQPPTWLEDNPLCDKKFLQRDDLGKAVADLLKDPAKGTFSALPIGQALNSLVEDNHAVSSDTHYRSWSQNGRAWMSNQTPPTAMVEVPGLSFSGTPAGLLGLEFSDRGEKKLHLRLSVDNAAYVCDKDDLVKDSDQPSSYTRGFVSTPENFEVTRYLRRDRPTIMISENRGFSPPRQLRIRKIMQQVLGQHKDWGKTSIYGFVKGLSGSDFKDFSGINSNLTDFWGSFGTGDSGPSFQPEAVAQLMFGETVKTNDTERGLQTYTPSTSILEVPELSSASHIDMLMFMGPVLGPMSGITFLGTFQTKVEQAMSKGLLSPDVVFHVHMITAVVDNQVVDDANTPQQVEHVFKMAFKINGFPTYGNVVLDLPIELYTPVE